MTPPSDSIFLRPSRLRPATLNLAEHSMNTLGTKEYPRLIGDQSVQWGTFQSLLSPLNPREKIVMAMHLVFGMSLAEIAGQLVRAPGRYSMDRPVRGRRSPHSISKRAVCRILRDARSKVFWHKSFQPRDRAG